MSLDAAAPDALRVVLLDERDFLPALAVAIHGARHNIAAAQYMIRAPRTGDPPIYANLWAALRAAGGRLDSCRLLLNQRFPVRQPPGFNLEAAGELAGHGWQLRYQPARLIAHQKLWLIDNHLLILGSSNTAHAENPTTTNLNALIRSRLHALHALTNYNKQWAAAATAPTP